MAMGSRLFGASLFVVVCVLLVWTAALLCINLAGLSGARVGLGSVMMSVVVKVRALGTEAAGSADAMGCTTALAVAAGGSEGWLRVRIKVAPMPSTAKPSTPMATHRAVFLVADWGESVAIFMF